MASMHETREAGRKIGGRKMQGWLFFGQFGVRRCHGAQSLIAQQLGRVARVSVSHARLYLDENLLLGYSSTSSSDRSI